MYFGVPTLETKRALFALELVSNKERLLLELKCTAIISLLANLHRHPFASTYKLQLPMSPSLAFQIMKAARPVRKPRREVLMVVKGDAALEELAADALEDVAEAVELLVAVGLEAEAEAEVEFELGRVALPAVLIPSAAS